MIYLMGEMMVWFLAVAILGIITGWLFTRASWKRKIEDAEVALLRQLHEVTKQLDTTQQQLQKTSERLEQERAGKNNNSQKIESLQAELAQVKARFEERKQQVLDMTQSFDEVHKQLQAKEEELERQEQENQKIRRDFEAIKHRLSVFQSDLDEIAQQSSILRTAFEKARLELVSKDKRIAELESISSEGLQMAALSGNAEPELAISRIARLQTRVQELFEEVTQKDRELEELKNAIPANDQRSIARNMEDLQGDNLQQISGIGEALEKKLNQMGITRFSDIAGWDDGDIDRFDQKLDFHGRIRRENWVEQARQLSKSHSNRFRGH